MDPNRAFADDVESNVPAPAPRIAPATSRPNDSSDGGEAKEAFFRMMSEWFLEFVRTNSAVPQPPPPQIPIVPQVVDPIRLNKPHYGAEEFRATADDVAERVELWIENTIRTLISVVPRERITWDFFQVEFRKKYISQWFIDQKRRELLELKQGCMSITEYEREFVRLSQYAQKCVSIEAPMCKHFIEGLNEDIKLLVGTLDINEFVVLVERVCKAEELSKENKKADSEARDERKRSMSRFSQPPMKRFRDASNRSNISFGHSRQSVGPRTQAPIQSSVGSVKSNKPECRLCVRRDGKYNNRVCYKCESRDHFIRDYLELAEKDNTQNVRLSNMSARGRPPRNIGNVSGSQRRTMDTTVRSEARAPAQAYAIRAREEASSPDVITVLSKTLPVESTEFVIRVSNPLGKCVLVDKVCKNCPLMFRDICFLANFMLLPFDTFDIILGMNWLTLHNTISIYLRSQNDEIVRIESSDLNGLPAVISLMKALNYVRKGCEAYLAYVIDTKVSEKKVESVPMNYWDYLQSEKLNLVLN
ncbi:Gag-Pol polyprotein [Gossypium australe]|uniref:Gag-Pol polyprotein n=1 Tax=Gossypium australe TaxID=47621 RepID=A0A5B6VN62_9ROSI|nr:Gag-Pol polyprotein [Gossypium australe]